MARFYLLALPLALAACDDKSTPGGDDTAGNTPDTLPLEEDVDGDGFASDEDCDDADAAVNPGADEACDGADNNCDGVVDEGLTTTFYADSDADGYGDPDNAIDACELPEGYVEDSADCDDASAENSPAGTEICDEADNNCDGAVDEDSAADTSTWYLDSDGDGYGDQGVSVDACFPPFGYTDVAGDCDDADPERNETCTGFASFDGTTGKAWETLTSSSSASYYGLMTYHPSDYAYVYATQGSTNGYDPASNSWTTFASSAPYSGGWPQMAPWDGDLWMVRNSSIYQYDPDFDTWATVGTFTGSEDASMTESDENGILYAHSGDGTLVTYDTATGAVGYYPTGLGSQYETRLAYDPISRAIFFGAFYMANLYRFDIATGSITTMTPNPEGYLHDIFCSDRSGHIYSAGGYSGKMARTMWQYDVATDTWSQIPDLPVDNGNNGTCVVSADGWLYVGVPESQSFHRLALY